MNCRRFSSYQIKPEGRLTEGRRLPAWQLERENRLHRKFLSVQAALEKGATFKQATKQFVWFWRKRGYRCNRNRQARFSAGTLRHLYNQWRKNGGVRAALRLNFRGLKSSIPAPVLCRFVELCAALRFPNMKTAWSEFLRRKKGKFGCGLKATNPLRISYGQLQYVFSGRKFADLQSAQRAIEIAENCLATLRVEYAAEIRRRLPDQPRRQRRTSEGVSRDCSAL